MYLEPIFGSEDIMRQLPTEARRFNDVDKYWKKVMADAFTEPGFMLNADQEKKLEPKFQAANEKLDTVQKGLAEYVTAPAATTTTTACTPNHYYYYYYYETTPTTTTLRLRLPRTHPPSSLSGTWK